MKATGIVRRIDDLGRVVIPKEIRRTMRIREGDPSQISLIPWKNLCVTVIEFGNRMGLNSDITDRDTYDLRQTAFLPGHNASRGGGQKNHITEYALMNMKKCLAVRCRCLFCVRNSL